MNASTWPCCSIPTSSSPATIPAFTSRFSAVSIRSEISTPERQKNPTPKPKRRSSKTPKNPVLIPTTPPASGIPTKKVLVPIGFGTEDMEAVIITGVLRRAGAAVTVASVEEQLEVEASGGTRLVADTFIADCSDEIFDLVALPGGMPGSARLRDCKILQQITSKHAEGKRLYGAICSAPAVTLLPWGLTRRKQTTCHPAFMDKLPTFWAVKSNLQVSGELTTSRGPGTSFEFAVSLVGQLFSEAVATKISASMLLNDANDNSRKEEVNGISWSLDHTPQVIIPVANGSEEIEVVTIVDILRRAKANVTIASVENSLQIKASCGSKIIAEKMISTAAESVYDLIILPGGKSGAERLNKSKVLKKLLKEQALSGRILGAIGSSPTILKRQGLLKEKRVTAHPSVVSTLDVAESRAQVVIDSNVITSKGLGTAFNFALAIVSKFFGQARATSVAEGLVFKYPR